MKAVLALGLLGLVAIPATSYLAQQTQTTSSKAQVVSSSWAFEETFDVGVPTAPSQSLLSKRFDYVATHRNHPASPHTWSSFPADHGSDCKAAATADPISGTNPILQHSVNTDHVSNGTNPETSFFLCNNHMMSSMGNVDGYSVTAFYPRQEFDFSAGNGILEWDVNLNTGARSWWEVMITPKENTQLGAAKAWLPISETYPKQSIILSWMNESRHIEVYGQQPAPDNALASSGDWRRWGDWVVKGDPALTDRRMRRKMRVKLNANKIEWEVQKPDGTFDLFSADVPAGLPITRGLVFFKTHAYTPEKDGNMDMYTYHWDNIRFNGPTLAPYESYEIPGLVLLNGNGSVPIGSTKTVTLNLPKVGQNPVLLGQTQMGQPGQVLLSINGSPNLTVQPHSHSSKENPCYYDGWRTFRTTINPALLKVGENTFKWTVGPRPSCASGQWWWDGFAVKAFEVQFDGSSTGGPTATLSPSPVTSVSPTLTLSPTTSTSPTPSKTPTPTPSISPSPSLSPSPSPSLSPSPTLSPTVVSGSILKIYAAGSGARSVFPNLRLQLFENGAWINAKEFRNVQGNPNAAQYITLSYTHPTKVQPANVRVRFTNDFYDQKLNEDRNVRIDKIEIDGVGYQSESPQTFSNGSWRASDGCKQGYKQSEWLHCNGYFQYRQ